MPLKVTLVAHGDEDTCAKAALTCTSAKAVEEIFSEQKKQLSVLSRVYEMGHTSISEHMWFTFTISGVSRALSHQLVRTRMASYSQRSQRYVTEGQFSFVVPPSIERNPSVKAAFEELMADINKSYEGLILLGIPAEDARFVLPNACETQLVMTLNARSLIHFLAERLCQTAQWEIRAMAKAMFEVAKKASPTLMQFAGPKCQHQMFCKEDKKRWNKCQKRIHWSDMLIGTSEAMATRASVLAQLVTDGIIPATDVPSFKFTCDACPSNGRCEWAFDPYNLNGDCLAEK